MKLKRSTTQHPKQPKPTTKFEYLISITKINKKNTNKKHKNRKNKQQQQIETKKSNKAW